MSGKYRGRRSPEGVTEGADAMSYYNALQFTARYKLATMCPALSFSVNPFAAHAAPRRHSKTITARRKVSGGIGHSVPVAVAARIRVFTRRTAPYLGAVC